MVKLREKVTEDVLNELLEWLGQKGNEIGILDGSNGNKERREEINEIISKSENVHKPLWIEIDCEDNVLLQKNFELTKLPELQSDRKLDRNVLLKSYNQRIEYMRKDFSPISVHSDWNYIIIRYNDGGGNHHVINNLCGYLPAKIVSFLLNLYPIPHTVYISRHGQSEYNVENRIGGDSPLSILGEQYAENLGEFVKNCEDLPANQLSVWTSTLKRTIQTSEHIYCQFRIPWRALDEIDAGICEDLTYEEVDDKYPEIATGRGNDKLGYRYPSGESYMDVIQRLEPVILEMERTTRPLIIIAHQAVIRCLFAYFLDLPKEKVPRVYYYYILD